MINEAKTKITAPISIEDVRQVLTAGDRDLASLCTHPNINIWARRKPTDNDSLTDRGSSSGIKVTFDESANPYRASLRTFVHDAPKGGIHSPFRLTDWEGYYHLATSPVNNITYNSYGGSVSVNVRQAQNDKELTMSAVVSEYGALLEGKEASDNMPDTSGWYLCAVFLATNNADDLIMAWSEKSKGDGGDIVERTASTRSTSSTVVSDGDDGGEVGGDTPTDGDGTSTTSDVDAGDTLPDDTNTELNSQLSGWDFSDETSEVRTYNFDKGKFGDLDTIVYYTWATASTPLDNMGDSVTINVKNIQNPWSRINRIDGNDTCQYRMAFLCLANQQFDSTKEYETGDVLFLPIPTKKVRDAFFYASDNINIGTLLGESGDKLDEEEAERG